MTDEVVDEGDMVEELDLLLVGQMDEVVDQLI
jgi:hypothetical protein